MLLDIEIVRHYLQQSFKILCLRKDLRQVRHNCFLRFDDPETNPYPLKYNGLDKIGPFYIAEKDITEKTTFVSCNQRVHSTWKLPPSWQQQITGQQFVDSWHDVDLLN